MGLFYVHIPKSYGKKKKKLPNSLGMKKMSKSPKMQKLLKARAQHRKFLISHGINPDKKLSDIRKENQNRPIVQKHGAIAQAGERLVCNEEVVGSIPSGSTIDKSKFHGTGGTKPSHNWRLEESKNFTVAPAYNKGAYQVISRKDVKDIGR
tara:strand:+ start:1428 stop:1880 length:453 start_codon:yes stop_codon:yes gene_type:complete